MSCGSIRQPMPLDFPSDKELRKHTRRHWREFNLIDEHAQAEYLALARAFCDEPLPIDTDECVRTCDNMIDRFREVSGEFAVMMPRRSALLTFHILYPFGTVGVERTHHFLTNREYYEADCQCLIWIPVQYALIPGWSFHQLTTAFVRVAAQNLDTMIACYHTPNWHEDGLLRDAIGLTKTSPNRLGGMPICNWYKAIWDGRSPDMNCVRKQMWS